MWGLFTAVGWNTASVYIPAVGLNTAYIYIFIYIYIELTLLVLNKPLQCWILHTLAAVALFIYLSIYWLTRFLFFSPSISIPNTSD